ncbi:dUTP diphosphatase [Brevibacillus sp. WF146]|uniref:dUTP diphosphatase n=1 Tax=Brevibacillus sp. WF146 TaxID=319501 RepID=UPI0007ED43EA|nr:dUTP diphosphatase [Brevibacillus sp. WF146]UYZ15588.1 dUTP diphosphatase [Brevibacillus sp. WF146]
MRTIPVKIKRLHPDAVIPQYATADAAGFDLVAVEDVIIAPGETVKVCTGLAFELPPGYELQIRPRSGISAKTKLRVANAPGTVDADYRGEVCVLIDNVAPVEYEIQRNPRLLEYESVVVKDKFIREIDGSEFVTDGWVTKGTYIIRKGERIAQGVLTEVPRAAFEVVDELSETERGAGGFGSTGTAV